MGAGPLGKIYRAVHEATGEKAVFRGFTRPEGADPEKWEAAKNQFRELLEQHHRIDKHPTIQAISGFGEEQGLFWIATEYFEGRTLQQILASGGAQDLPWCLEVMRQVADAVDYAGERGLPHTDLTPYNILLVNHRESPNQVDVRVINFGMAHARSKYGSRYAAPEQQNGFDGDRKSDVYAVGALLFEMLTGKPIFTGTTADEIAQKIRTEALPNGLSGRPSYVQNVLGAMLAKAPRFRYASVKEAINDLANKRSPAGADRHDGVEMDTARLLAERRGERKLSDTAESDLGAAFRETGNDERFHKLEIGDTVAPVAPGRPAAGRDMTAFAPGIDRITLQDYRLSEMDLLTIRYRADQAKAVAAAANEQARERWMPLLRWSVFLSVTGLLLGHAASVMADYREMHVVSVKGTATRQAILPTATRAKEAPKPVPLVAGETIRASDLPLYIATGADASATFALSNGEAVTIPAHSAIELRELGYNKGGVRRFRVWGGRVLFCAEKALRGHETFVVETGAGIRSNANGAARFSVDDSFADNIHYVTIASRAGTAEVEVGDGKTPIPAGQQIVVRIPGMPGDPVPLSPAAAKALSSDEALMTGMPAPPPAFLRSLAAAEETVLMPAVELIQSIVAIPARMNDGKNIAVANTSMGALCALMATSDSETGAPESLDLETLAPLSLPQADRKRILKGFENGKLLGYRTLPNGGYEILARANDTAHTWIRGKNGVATTAGTGAEPTN